MVKLYIFTTREIDDTVHRVFPKADSKMYVVRMKVGI